MAVAAGSDTPITMAEVKTLVAKREDLEKEIEELNAWLTAPGRPGMRGGLTDKDGFPLSDVQLVISTREARNKLAAHSLCMLIVAVLQNDHKALMKTIEESLQKLHAQAKAAKLNAPATPPAPVATPLIPFMRVNSVAEGSPAHKAGLLKDDLIAKLGSIVLRITPQEALQAVPTVVKEGIPLEVIVVRSEKPGQTKITLIPQHWAGPEL